MSNITNSTTDPQDVFFPITNNIVPSFPRSIYSCPRNVYTTPGASGIVGFSPLNNQTLSTAQSCCGEIWIQNGTCQGICSSPESDDTVKDTYDCVRDASRRARNNNASFWWIICQDTSCYASGAESSSASVGPSATNSAGAGASDTPVTGVAAGQHTGRMSTVVSLVMLASLVTGVLLV